MDMIRQHDNGINYERIAFALSLHAIAQSIDMFNEQCFPSLQQIDREERAAARNEGPTIVWHEERIARWLERRITLSLIRATDYGLFLVSAAPPPSSLRAERSNPALPGGSRSRIGPALRPSPCGARHA